MTAADAFYRIARHARDTHGPTEPIQTGSGFPLFASHASYGRQRVEAVIARNVLAQEVTLTTDGRDYRRGGWHQGPEAGWVYVERWDADGLAFHGFIDSGSRRLLQAG